MHVSFNQTLNFEKTRMKKDFHSINMAASNGSNSYETITAGPIWKYIYMFIYI